MLSVMAVIFTPNTSWNDVNKPEKRQSESGFLAVGIFTIKQYTCKSTVRPLTRLRLHTRFASQSEVKAICFTRRKEGGKGTAKFISGHTCHAILTVKAPYWAPTRGMLDLDQRGQDWLHIIRNFFTLDFCLFWIARWARMYWNLIWKVSDFSHLKLMWSILGPNLTFLTFT